MCYFLEMDTGGYVHWMLYGIVNLQRVVLNFLPIIAFIGWISTGLCCFVVSSENMNVVMNKTKRDWIGGYDDNMRPTGIIVHASFFPRYVIYRDTFDRHIYVYTTSKVMSSLLATQQIETVKPNVTQKVIKYLYRIGDAGCVRYRERGLNMPSMQFTDDQLMMFRSIQSFFSEHTYATVFIDGPPGSGKTSLAYLMANEIGAVLVDTFNPSEPSDSFDNLYTSVLPSYEKPLIVLLDEGEILLRSLTDGVPLHKNYIIHMRSKVHWNALLDKIQIGCYPNSILMICSNSSKHEIDKLDPSYLREGRINRYFTLGLVPVTVSE